MTVRATALFIVLAALITLTGCGMITGRSAGTWASDKATTAKVKAALAGAQPASMTKVDVDTNSGVVYLTGRVASEEARRDILRAAQIAADGKQVVSNLTVAGQVAAASPPTAASSAEVSRPPAPATRETQAIPPSQPGPPQGYIVYGPQGYRPQAPQAGGQQVAAATPPALTELRFSRIVPDAGATGRFAAYDATGKQVATVYALTPEQLRQRGVSNLETSQEIDHVSIYPHGGADGMQYHVVLWHVNREEAARLMR